MDEHIVGSIAPDEDHLTILFPDSERTLAEKVSASLRHSGLSNNLTSIEGGLDGIAGTILVIVSVSSFTPDTEQFLRFAELVTRLKSLKLNYFICPAGDIDPNSIPVGMLWEYYLFFSNPAVYQAAITQLVELLKPEVNRRKELLNRLKKPAVVDPYTYQELYQYLNLTHDQSLQCAAISGLERIGGTPAVVALGTRLLDPWGIKSVELTIKALGTLSLDGGLMCLAATLLFDKRFYYVKLKCIHQVLLQTGETKIASEIEPLLENCYPNLRDRLPFDFDVLENLPLKDIKDGVKIARHTKPAFDWTGKLQSIRAFDTVGSFLSATERLPGFVILLRENIDKAVDWD